MKPERTQIHFLSDVFVAVASLDLKSPYYAYSLYTRYLLVPTRKLTVIGMNTYPICDSPLQKSARRTESLSVMVVVPACRHKNYPGYCEHSLPDPLFCPRVNRSDICHCLIVGNLFFRCEILILLFRECYAIVGSCFSASLATKLANKLQEKLHSKAASVLRSCEDLPLLCYLLSCATLA